MDDPELEKIIKKKMEQMSNLAEKILELSEKNFDGIITGSKPVVVDFWASWCGPCKFMLPIFDKLAKIYGNKIAFARLNVDENQSVATRYDVYSIPTFIVFNNGKEVDRAMGAVGEPGLENLIKKHY
ncbi:MAG: thioredoxin [Thaumarchaeota archaeon]|nr:thioredoxin [Nitrososphaerota archaeon]